MPEYPRLEAFENLYPTHLICYQCHKPAEVRVKASDRTGKLYCRECFRERHPELEE